MRGRARRGAMRGWGALLVVVLVLGSGCLASPGATTKAAADGLLPDLSDVPAPHVDAHRARLWWEQFVNAYPERQSLTPTNVRAADQLKADLEAAGYKVTVLTFVPQTGAPAPAEGAGYRVVLGVKPGTEEPDHVLSWVAHYDSNRGTLYAAYDDGSGTAVAMELARVMAKTSMRKTLMPIFFDAEEQGLLASEYFVRDMKAQGKMKFDMVIGHDMTGINCPGHQWPMYQMTGENYADRLVPIELALYQKLGLDVGEGENATSCIVVLPKHDRNSDERHFKEAGIPILRMAGGRKAVDYPAYHQANDTVDYVYQFAGGPENYEKGLNLTVAASYWNLEVFDRLPPLAGGS